MIDLPADPFADAPDTAPDTPGRIYVEKRLPLGGGLAVSLDAVAGQPQTDDAAVSSQFVISTNDEDREGDVILPMGIGLDQYRLNPTVLWMHGLGGYPLPLGSSEGPGGLAIRLTESKAYGTCYYDQKSPFAMQVYDLVRRGLIRGASVKLIPDRGAVEKLGPRRGEGRGPILVRSGQLIEWSVCPVGVNPYAIKAELGKGLIDGVAIVPELAKCLAPYAAERAKAVATGADLPAADDRESDIMLLERNGFRLASVLYPREHYPTLQAADAAHQDRGHAVAKAADTAAGWAFEILADADCDPAGGRVEDVLFDARHVYRKPRAKAAVPAEPEPVAPPPPPDETADRLAACEQRIGELAKALADLTPTPPAAVVTPPPPPAPDPAAGPRLAALEAAAQTLRRDLYRLTGK